jgi:O-antigen/teichoic acid export membrane protein
MIDSVQSRFRSLLSIIKLKPFDTATADGRSKERLRRALLTSATAAIARVISMAGPLITVPIVIRYLGKEQYGLWMTVTSLIGMFIFADLGLGNGLMTAISQADGRGDTQESRRCIASTLFALSGVAGILLLLYTVSFHFIPWPRVLNAKSPELLRESGIVGTICFVTFLANLPFGVVQRIQCGLQEGFQSNCWQCVASVINVTAVLTAVRSHASLPVLVLAVAGVQPLVSLMNGWFFFGIQRPDLRPRFQDFDWATAQRLLAAGFWFFLVSVLMAIGISSDNMVVDQVIGLDKVSLYAVPARLAVYLGTVASMLYMPFWNANGEALARGDVAWVRRNTARVMKWNVLITGSAGAAFAIAGPIAVHWWIKMPDFNPGISVFIGMAVWAFITSVIGPLFMILNAANVVRVQAVMYAAFSTVAIILKVVLARRIGIAGVVWASVIPYVLIIVPATVWVVKNVLRRAEQLSLTVTVGPQCSLEPGENPIAAPE